MKESWWQQSGHWYAERMDIMWDREGGREIQEGGDMGIYVYI